MTTAHDRVVPLFESTFGTAPTDEVRAPGRVNLIGEHTDYNDGFVLPAAIDLEVHLALRPRTDRRIRAVSETFPGEVEIDLSDLGEPGSSGVGADWGDYLTGVAWSLEQAGIDLTGWDAAVTSDVPGGSGLSSSAAIELATARAFQAVSGFDWDPVAAARIARRAENDWVGVQSGIMDQLVSAVGRAGTAVLIDCRSLELRHVPIPAGVEIVVLDTGTRRALDSSPYNERFDACVRAAEAAGVAALRDLAVDDLGSLRSLVDPTTYRRARHVVTENDRTLRTATALTTGDLATVRELMAASHSSLRDDFEASTPALDAAAASAWAAPGCIGARMTGAGFGGCAVALVESHLLTEFIEQAETAYRSATGLEATLYTCRSVDGASRARLTA